MKRERPFSFSFSRSLPVSERPRERDLVELPLSFSFSGSGARLRNERPREWLPRAWTDCLFPVASMGEAMAADTDVMVEGCGICGLFTRSCICAAQEVVDVDERTCCCGKAKEASSGPNVSSKSKDGQ